MTREEEEMEGEEEKEEEGEEKEEAFWAFHGMA